MKRKQIKPLEVASLSRWLDHLFGPDWTDVKGIGGRYITKAQLMAATKEWRRLQVKDTKR